ncbi:MAG: hypothetical protein IJV96_03175 [Clostridia bacterium]|nr:hypothetical protein [Clostridia bacterium]
MPIYKIKPSEIEACRISNLPSRPSFPSLYSGEVLSASELRAAFDALPLLLADALNDLVDSLGLFEEKGASESFASLIATHIFEGHSLEDLFRDVADGSLATYFAPDGARPLAEILEVLEKDVDALKLISVETVGEGDCIYAASISKDNRLIFYKKDLLAELAEVLRKKVDDVTAAFSRRVSVLERAAEDTIYYYDYTEHTGATITPPQNSLGNAMLCTLWHNPPKAASAENLMPEAALPFLFPGTDGLSLTYDAQTSSLVLNGTLAAGASVEIPLYIPAKMLAYALKLFYLGGEVTSAGESPSISVVFSKGTESLTFALETGKTKSTLKPIASADEEMATTLSFSAAADTVFSDFRFQLSFNAYIIPETHEKTSFLRPIHTARAFLICAKNRWTGDSQASGTAAVTLSLKEPLPVGDYVLSFDHLAERSASRILIRLSFADGSEKDAFVTLQENNRAVYTLSASIPLASFTVYAASTASQSTGVKLLVKNVMLEEKNGDGVFMPRHEDVRIPLPDALTSLPGYGHVFDAQDMNYYDFESFFYANYIKTLSLCGEEAWEETDTAGVFALPIDEEPEALKTSGFFQFDETDAIPCRVWYEEGRLMLACPNVTTKETLCALLAAQPFCVTFLLPYEEYSFPPALLENGEAAIYLPLEKGDTVKVVDENGEAVSNAVVNLLYQLKLV